MNKQIKIFKHTLYQLTFVLIFILSSCESLTSSPSTQIGNSNTTNTTLIQPNGTAVVTIPALPSVFQTTLLNPRDTPHTYVDETCRYLRNKWNPSNAEPGTVVMALKIGTIQTGAANEPESINVSDFMKIMDQLKTQGFEAINMRQFLFFIERNVHIPPRSVLLIQDGNFESEYYFKYYSGYWKKWHWPVVNGWQSDSGTDEFVVRNNIEMERQGWVDHQAQGVNPDSKLSDDSAKSVIAGELQTPLDVFAREYQKNPYAVIWPNGGFGLRPVEAARLLGYQVGFTENSRGPVLYNWIPLGDEKDPQRPGYTPEGPINDPLMTIPRYSTVEAFTAIDQVRAIGKEASAYAQENKKSEFEYYDIVCSDTYGPIPTP